jgi:hypothetical protein
MIKNLNKFKKFLREPKNSNDVDKILENYKKNIDNKEGKSSLNERNNLELCHGVFLYF